MLALPCENGCVGCHRCEARPGLTAAFDDPQVESSFAANLFRAAFGWHALLLVSVLATISFAALTTGTWPAMTFVALLLTASALVGRVFLHRKQDRERSQKIGSWFWSALLVLSCGVDVVSYLTDAEAACASERKVGVTRPLICLAAALVNGSHGMSFLHKLSLVVVLLIDILTALASCGELAQALSIGATVVGYVAAHLVELNARRAFAKERRSEEEKRLLAEEKHRAEEEAETRLEQLAVAKERLQYDFNFVMARAHPLAGPSQPRRQSSSSGSSSLGGSGAPSSSPPPSIPPMAPSSIADSRASGLTPNDLMTGENEPMSEDEAETSQLGRGEVMDPSDVEAEFSAQEQAGSPAAAGDAIADVAQAVAASGADADAVAANIIAQHAQSSVQPPPPPAPLSHAQPLESLVDISFHCLGCLSRGLVWNKSGCLGITTCRCIARRIEKGSG